MTDLVASQREMTEGGRLPSILRWFVPLTVITVVGMIAAIAFPWADRWPQEWVPPIKLWITRFFAWLGSEAGVGSLKFREVTRGVSWVLSWPLSWMEAMLFRGLPPLGAPPLPWIVVAAGAGILGHWIKGGGLGIFCIASALYLAVFGLWSDAMQTLALVLVTVPFAALLGLGLGIAATRSRRLDALLTAAFDVMQATPHMAYLAPVVVLFGFGQVPALIATAIFAMPPMARCAILGIRTVSSDIMEAGRMSGCTSRQLLWKVELPAAHRILMLGLNQVVMQTLAMAVIASLVGASGLGQKLLFSLQQLYIGKATEQGIAIVLLAIVLDRLTQGYAYRPLARAPIGTAWWARHRHLLAFSILLATTYLLSFSVPAIAVLPKELTVSFGPSVDEAVRWISRYLYDYISPARDWITLYILLPIRDFYLFLPWPLVMGAIGFVAWRLGGLRLTTLALSLIAAIMLSGNWVPAMLTVYLVTAASVICVLIGVPIGVWASRSERVARVTMAICDTLQTFPSFVYLIPVIMLFKVGDLSNVVAILAYASVPAIRYTYLGIKRVAPATIEAARAIGTTSLQRLWKVELPIALPEIMLGINQTIMMALAMTAITALIGSRDLGQEIYKALPGADTGRGLLAGLSIAFIGIVADRLIGAWALRRRKALGLI